MLGRRIRSSASGGFTLVETLAALLVFSLVTIGLIPLMAASLRGPNLSRSFTVGKNIAVEAMERVRGLPFYRSQTAAAGDVDVLDYYFPRYDAASPTVFTTICVGGARVLPSCPRDVPSGYTVTFRASFVAADGGTVLTPPATYDSDVAAADEPPSQLLRMTVTTSWQLLGQARNYTLDTVVGARLSDLAVQGVAIVNYGVKVSTSFEGSEQHSLTVTAGNSDSRIETRSASVADQAVRVARLELVNVTDPTEPDLVEEGDVELLHAPPTPPTPVDASAPAVALSLLGLQVAGVDETLAGESAPEADLEVDVSSELPRAQGGFTFGSPAGEADGEMDVWVDHPHALRFTEESCGDADDGEEGESEDPGCALRLLPGADLVQLRQQLGESLSGWALTETGAVGSFDRGVRGRAHVEFPQLALFPTTFAPDGVFLVESFQADVSCDATANAFSAAASAGWGATIRYWDGLANAYSTPMSVSVSAPPAAGTDPLRPLRDQNPIILVDPDVSAERVEGSAAGDVHLFPAVHEHPRGDGTLVRHEHQGYLRDLQGLRNPRTVPDAQSGRTAVANTTGSVGGAISIDTVPIPTAEDSGFNPTAIGVLLGSLECRTEDAR